MLYKILDKLKSREDFNEWNKNNKLSQDGEPLLVFHGSFSAEKNIEEINFSKNNDGIHFSGGLYTTNNIEEVSEYYSANALNNKNSDINAVIEEIVDFFINENDNFSGFLNKIVKIEEKSYLSEKDKMDLSECEDKEELLEKLKKYLKDDDFLVIFNKTKTKIDELDLEDYKYIKEIVKNNYIAHHGIIFPIVIKMENPFICIDDNIDSEYEPSKLLYLETDIETLSKNTEYAINIIIEKINQECEEELIDKNIFSPYCNGIIDKEELLYIAKSAIEQELENLDLEIDLDDLFEEIADEIEDEEFLLIEESEIEEYIKAYENTESIINRCYDYDIDTTIIRDTLTQLFFTKESILINARDFIFKLKENDYEVYKEVINKVIPEVYDGSVFNAHFEFDYVKDNYNDDTYHYINYRSENVKYLMNNAFTNKETIMERKMDYMPSGCHIPISEIKEVISKFQENYPEITKINLSSFKDKVIADIDKKTGFINLYIENIKSKEELEKTLLHEYVVHYGLEKVLGNEAKELLEDTYNHYKNTKEFDVTRNKYSEYKENTESGRLKLAEEHLAYVAENQLYKKDKFAFNILYKLNLLFKKIKEKLGIKNFENKLFLKLDFIDNKLKTIRLK